MRNKYEIRGDVTAIFIESPKYGRLESLISTSDLDRAMEFPNTWTIAWSKSTRSFYCKGSLTVGIGKRTTIMFHRWLTNCPDDMEVDHINHKTLNNTRTNLRLVTTAENQQNRFAKKNCQSGVRGVSWENKKKKWRGLIGLKGKKIHVGYFETIEECELAVTTARKNIMPFSTGNKRSGGAVLANN